MMSWGPIRRSRCVALATYKKDGTPVTTPMWVAVEQARILATSDFDPWKLKRIEHNPRALLAPCTIRDQVCGDFIDGRARVMNVAETEEAIAGKTRHACDVPRAGADSQTAGRYRDHPEGGVKHPIARVPLPQRIPFRFHGNWISDYVVRVTA